MIQLNKKAVKLSQQKYLGLLSYKPVAFSHFLAKLFDYVIL